MLNRSILGNYTSSAFHKADGSAHCHGSEKDQKKSALIQRVHPISAESKAPQFIHEYDAELRGRVDD